MLKLWAAFHREWLSAEDLIRAGRLVTIVAAAVLFMMILRAVPRVATTPFECVMMVLGGGVFTLLLVLCGLALPLLLWKSEAKREDRDPLD